MSHYMGGNSLKRNPPNEPPQCYNAKFEDGLFKCPECNSVEGGTYRIISNHRYDCPNRLKEYCQRVSMINGKATRKSRKEKSRKSRKGKSRKSRR